MGLNEVAGEGSGTWNGRSVDRRRDSKALPCKSFEPIGRHARIVRVTLQDCRLGRLGGPTPRNITLPRAWPLPCTSREALRCLSAVRIRSKPPVTDLIGMPHEQAIRPEFGGFWHFPDLWQKFADPERRVPDLPQKFPVRQRREFAAKSLIVRPEVRTRLPEQAIFGENSL